MFVVSRMKLSQNFWLAEKFLFISQINLDQNPTLKKIKENKISHELAILFFRQFKLVKSGREKRREEYC